MTTTKASKTKRGAGKKAGAKSRTKAKPKKALKKRAAPKAKKRAPAKSKKPAARTPIEIPPMEMRKVADLAPAPYNPRSITKEELDGLRASIERFGLVEPLIVNRKTGYVVGGHQRLKVLIDAGVKETPVVVVDLDDANEKALNITLNNPGITGDFDDGLADLLASIAEDIGPVFEELNLDELLPSDIDPVRYTSKITAPIYEPKGRRPQVRTLCDSEKTRALVAEIEATDELPADVAKFLKLAAERHTRFHFARIAEFYAHAPAHVQDLFERSALVIIDFDKAIEYGFTTLTEKLGEIEEDDRDE